MLLSVSCSWVSPKEHGRGGLWAPVWTMGWGGAIGLWIHLQQQLEFQLKLSRKVRMSEQKIGLLLLAAVMVVGGGLTDIQH